MKIDKYNKYILSKVLVAYLIEGKSHRKIQREILELPAPANGGGFITMQILHHYKIKGDDKGILKANLSNIKEIEEEARVMVENYLKLKDEASLVIEKKKINPNKNKTERYSYVKTRVYQDILKKYVMHNYGNQCALCDIDQAELLVASHIIPWSVDESKRLELENCILLCSIHDKLFDKGFIAFNDKNEVIISETLSKNVIKYTKNISLRLPINNYPEKQYLKRHYEEVFRGFS